MKPARTPFFWLILVAVIFFFSPEVSSTQSGFKIETPEPFFQSYHTNLEISGNIPGGANFKINGQDVSLDGHGNFKTWVKLINPGRNDFFLTASARGKSISYRLPVVKIKTFTDIEGHPARQAIENLATLKIFGNLCTEDSFLPEATLSRAGFCVWLVETMGIKKPARPSKSSFKDIGEESPLFPFTENALQNHWIEIGPEKRFYPEQEISRGQALVWLLRAVKLTSFEKVCSENIKKYQYLAGRNGFFPKNWQKARYILNFQPALKRWEAAWLFNRTKSARLQYQLLFLEESPIVKEVTVNERTENQDKVAGFKIKLQLPEPFYTRQNIDVFLSFPGSSLKSIKLLPEGTVSPADEVIYAGGFKTESKNPAGLFPIQLTVAEDNGFTRSQIFASPAEIQKFNCSVKNAEPEIFRLTLTPDVFSKNDDQPVLVEITPVVKNKSPVKKIFLNLENIGKQIEAPAEDDGLLGDKKAADGIYSLLIKPAPGAIAGREKNIPVVIEGKNGLKKFENITLKIVE